MLVPRIIPCLLLKGNGLVKTIKFKDEKYVGDPINAIKIFNEKGADELIFLDISATLEKRKPSFDIIEKIAEECFMPVCYGGGVVSIDEMKQIFSLGVEKVSLNTSALENPKLVEKASSIFGSQSIIISIDVKKNWEGKYRVYNNKIGKITGVDPVEYALQMQANGAGEILLTSIDREGTFKGYDIEITKRVSEALEIPVIANGGAGAIKDFIEAINNGGVSGVAAGSMFVFYGKHKAVLITYPSEAELSRAQC